MTWILSYVCGYAIMHLPWALSLISVARRQGIFEGYKFSWLSWLLSNPRMLFSKYILVYYICFDVCTVKYIHLHTKLNTTEITNLLGSTKLLCLENSLPYCYVIFIIIYCSILRNSSYITCFISVWKIKILQKYNVLIACHNYASLWICYPSKKFPLINDSDEYGV